MTIQPLMMAEGMLCLTTVSPWQQGREFIIDRAVSGSHYLRCCISREKLKNAYYSLMQHVGQSIFTATAQGVIGSDGGRW